LHDPSPPAIYPLSLHDALPISTAAVVLPMPLLVRRAHAAATAHLENSPATLIALADVVLPSSELGRAGVNRAVNAFLDWGKGYRSEEHTSELQSRGHLVCRLLL